MSNRKKRTSISKMLSDIFDYYKDSTLIEIVEDIHSKIGKSEKIEKNTNSTEIFYEHSLLNEAQVKSMSNADLSIFLERFQKKELLSFCKNINLKLTGKESKNLIIERIINHYTFINLPKRMADRDSNEIPFENNNSNSTPNEASRD